MNNDPDAVGSPTQTASPSGDGLQKYSCVLCSQRKVKCDRHEPCAGCLKASAQCLYVAPAPPKRGKRKTVEELQATRQKRLHKALGTNIPASHASSSSSKGDHEAPRKGSDHPHKNYGGESGKLVVLGGRSKYIVNNLWRTLTDETTLERLSDEEESTTGDHQPSSTIEAGSFVFDGVLATTTAQLIHPAPVQMFRLWQIFLDNVDPLLKVVHAPSFQQQIFTLSGGTDNISKATEALMFSIYAMAVLSTEETDCLGIFGEPKSSILLRYQQATRQALINAGYLRTSDLVVLQAYFLFLCSIRQQTDADSLWALTGIAVRIAERMGLHKDGALHGLNPFQVEFRRRLWWQLVILDGQTAQLAGSSVKLLSVIADTKRPLNINDSDLYPDMKHVPAEHNGPTQMCFVLLRVDTSSWLQRNRPLGLIGGGEEARSKINMADREKMIDELEMAYDERYIRNYDRSIPLHFLTMHVANLVICHIKWMANNPQHRAGIDHEATPDLEDQLFSTAMKILECELLMYSNKSLQRFRWHSQSQTQWNTFVYILSELRQRCDSGSFGSEVKKAWSLIEQALESRQDVLTDYTRPLHVAVGNALLTAWDAYERATNDRDLRIPSFVNVLCAHREAKTNTGRLRRDRSQNTTNVQAGPPSQQIYSQYPSTNSLLAEAETWPTTTHDYQAFDFAEPLYPASLSLNPVDWSEWDTLLQIVDDHGNALGDQTFLR